MSSNHRTINLQRRHFVKTVGLVASGVTIVQWLPRAAHAADLPRLQESDPIANAMGYKEDTTTVNKKDYPDHTDQQTCLNCKAWQGAQTDEVAGCRVFSGKGVTAKGWCQVWEAGE